MSHSSLAIANEFLKRARTERRPLTPMQLQKLVYLAHGWTLAVTGRPLIEEPIEAWEYGPVIRKLYEALRYFGGDNITRLLRWGDDTLALFDNRGTATAELSQDEVAVVDRVWENYKAFPAFQLSALTHAAGSPWDRTYRTSVGKNRVIDNNLIWDYFTQLAAHPHG